jgi:hypothetical protein
MSNLSRRSERAVTRAANGNHPVIATAGGISLGLSIILAWMMPTIIDPLFWLVGAPVGITLLAAGFQSTITRRSTGLWLAGSSAAMTLFWYFNHGFLMSVYASIFGVAMVVGGAALGLIGTNKD